MSFSDDTILCICVIKTDKKGKYRPIRIIVSHSSFLLSIELDQDPDGFHGIL